MIKVFGAQKVTERIRSILDNLSPQTYDVIGRRSVRRIVEWTQKGYSLAFGDKPVPFDALAPLTIAERERLSKFNRTAKDYSASKSNLTFTGQLLRAVKHRVQGKKVFIEVSGPRKAYKYSEKGKRGSAPDNAKVAEGLTQQGRAFLGLDLEGKKEIRAVIAKELIRQFRKSGF